MKVPIPQTLALKISNDAIKFAREEMRGYGWSDKALQALQPMPGEGVVGIKTTLKYLMYQEKGTKPFLMWWVQGRTVPMGCKQGDGPHFRRGSGVGQPGYVDIPHVGRVWRDQKWHNPGVKGRGFMQKGVQQAIKANQAQIQQFAHSLLGGGPR
jgi:hypothetical protein